MNRLTQPSTVNLPTPTPYTITTPPAENLASLRQRLKRSNAGWQLFQPLHYEANYAYPLLVWLHDDGGDDRELHQVLPLVSLRNYAGLAIRGERPIGRGKGYVWAQNAGSVLTAENQLLDGLAAAKARFNINPQRVFLAGLGTGGAMAVRLALRLPELVAGAASLVGGFPQGDAPLSRLHTARHTPLLIAQARDSETYCVDRLCDDLRLFHSAGLKVHVRQYPCGDELTTQMLHDLDVWTMERVTGSVSASQPASCWAPEEPN